VAQSILGYHARAELRNSVELLLKQRLEPSAESSDSSGSESDSEAAGDSDDSEEEAAGPQAGRHGPAEDAIANKDLTPSLLAVHFPILQTGLDKANLVRRIAVIDRLGVPEPQHDVSISYRYRIDIVSISIGTLAWQGYFC
jgi:hypothetical protein